MALEKELETYPKDLPALQDREGKSVLIQGGKVIEVFSSYEDALKQGYKECGLDTPFLVEQIRAVEKVQHLTRNIGFPCRT